MTEARFRNLLSTATEVAFTFAKRYVSHDLPAECFRYRVSLNQSYDAYATTAEIVYPQDDGRVLDNLTDTDVVATLWRDGRCPVWIDISVEAVGDGVTVFRLLCAGRYTTDEQLMYYAKRGMGPFGIKSPNLPPTYREGDRFALAGSRMPGTRPSSAGRSAADASYSREMRAIHGSLLGSVVGDALGLPYEALSARRGARLLGTPERHRFIFGRGMMSDDGEHACMVAKALVESGLDVERFKKRFAWQLRWWLLGVPAGVGAATLKATLRLWLGFPPSGSGVFSAGNGPAMRSAVLGVALPSLPQVRAFVRASTTITHTDPKAFHGALAIALAARCASEGKSPHALVPLLRDMLDEPSDCLELVEEAIASVARGETTRQFAEAIGCANGVSGYVLRTVPVAIHAWASHPGDYRAAVMTAIACGGDTDTVASCVGGIVGAGVGVDGIPQAWRDRLLEWPRSVDWIGKLARSVSDVTCGVPDARAPSVGPLVLFRNLLFVFVVFVHLLRRALPPY